MSCSGSPGIHNDAAQHNISTQNILNNYHSASALTSQDESVSGEEVRILPVTEENLRKLESAEDINLSLPITSTYLRQMRHNKPEMETYDHEAAREADQDEEEVGLNFLHKKYQKNNHWRQLTPTEGLLLHLFRGLKLGQKVKTCTNN